MMGQFSFRGLQVLLVASYISSWLMFGVDAIPMESRATAPVLPRVPLRVLPLGDSITYGYPSSDGNGYRKVLFDALAANGNVVDFIGSLQAGNMTDNYNEGHPGAVITQIGVFALASLPARPNVIVLLAGTNDMVGAFNVPGAPLRLGALIDQCHLACPDAVIIVGQLPPSTNSAVQANINAYNPTIPGIVASRVANGVKAVVVNMSAYLTTADLTDIVHPNDGGYKKMALGWIQGFAAANAKGWITPPAVLAAPPQAVGLLGTVTPGVATLPFLLPVIPGLPRVS